MSTHWLKLAKTCKLAEAKEGSERSTLYDPAENQTGILERSKSSKSLKRHNKGEKNKFWEVQRRLAVQENTARLKCMQPVSLYQLVHVALCSQMSLIHLADLQLADTRRNIFHVFGRKCCVTFSLCLVEVQRCSCWGRAGSLWFPQELACSLAASATKVKQNIYIYT